MPAVSNSSPLILYAGIGRLDLLRDVFTEIIVPMAVWEEVVAQGAGRPGATDVERAPWIRRQALPPEDPAQALLADLGPGEAQAIALAAQLAGPEPILLDDRKARRIAREYGLSVIGSAGVVALAKDLDLISSVRPLIDDLRTAGLYLSDSALGELLVIAGEHDPKFEHG